MRPQFRDQLMSEEEDSANLNTNKVITSNPPGILGIIIIFSFTINFLCRSIPNLLNGVQEGTSHA